MKICDIMTDRVVSVTMGESVSEAARLMKRCNIGALPVCDSGGRLRGILTDRDIVLRCVAEEGDVRQRKVEDVMSRSVVTTEPFAPVAKAAEMMSRDQIRRLPVLDSGHLVGMVALCDLARSCSCEMEASETLADISANVRRR